MASEAPLLTPLAEDIWIVDGPTIDFYRIPFPTRMTVIRLANGELFLHSPINWTPELAAALEELGPIRHLVSPNWIHYAYIGDWAARYPEATSWASPGVRARAESRNVKITFDRDLAEAPAPEWAEDLDQLIVEGSKVHTEVVFFHKKSRTLVLTDLIENMARKGSAPVGAALCMGCGNSRAPRKNAAGHLDVLHRRSGQIAQCTDPYAGLAPQNRRARAWRHPSRECTATAPGRIQTAEALCTQPLNQVRQRRLKDMTTRRNFLKTTALAPRLHHWLPRLWLPAKSHGVCRPMQALRLRLM